jgi:hypothetical protein
MILGCKGKNYDELYIIFNHISHLRFRSVFKTILPDLHKQIE